MNNACSLSDKNQVTIVVYVDDLMITSLRERDLQKTIDDLRHKLKNITVHEGKIHSYLGMRFDFSTPGQVSITMPGYVEDTLREYAPHSPSVLTPALSDLFNIDTNADKLDAQQSRIFHTCVAKLLYLAKRTRPDILLPVNFLCTRVRDPTVEDQRKLDRVLRYLKGTKEIGITLSPAKTVEVDAHVDASYATHADAKGHTGIVIALGNGPVFVRSSKQKLVARSSTESELIGLADAVTQVIWCREFLLSQGYKLDETVVYQDNASTVALANKGQSTSEATRHINVRFFYVHDKIASGDIKLVHKYTNEMVADILTKPLQGSLFRKLRQSLLNWKV